MDIKEYLRIFRRYWWVIVLVTLIGTGLGYATTFSFVNKYLPSMFSTDYQSSASLFVATQNGTSVSEAYQNNLFSQDRVVSYAALATSEQVAARAVDQLKANISVDELRGKTSAKARDKTVLLDVSVRDHDPAQAQAYANAVADSLVGLVGELETSRRGGTPAAGAVMVDDANYPTKTMGLSIWLRLGLGAAAGLVLGLLIAVITGALDQRLRGRESLETATDSVVLGGLPVDPERAKAGFVDLAAGGLYAERIRELRTNLRFATPNGTAAPRVIAVTSPSSEDGRTTVAIDLAVALAESGRSVVLVDGSLRGPALADRLPLNKPMRAGAAQRGLSTVLVGEHDLAECLIDGVPVGAHSISLLPAGPQAPRPGELWAADSAPTLFDRLGREFDYVIVDTPPLDAYHDGALIGALCDGALMVAGIRKTSTAALRRALHKLATANVTLIGTVVTFEPVGMLDKRRQRKQADRDAEGTNPNTSGGGASGREASSRHAAADSRAVVDPTLVTTGTIRRAPRTGRESH